MCSSGKMHRQSDKHLKASILLFITIISFVQVTLSLIVKDYLNNIDAMRNLFFSKQTDHESLTRFQQLLNEYSTPMLVLDLKLLRCALSLCISAGILWSRVPSASSVRVPPPASLRGQCIP